MLRSAASLMSLINQGFCGALPEPKGFHNYGFQSFNVEDRSNDAFLYPRKKRENHYIGIEQVVCLQGVTRQAGVCVPV